VPLQTRKPGGGPGRTRRTGTTLLALAFLALPLVLMSCYPGEITNIEELDTVGTLYNPNVQYSRFYNYFMPDSVSVTDERSNPGESTLPPGLADDMLNTVASRLASLGYMPVGTVAEADVGVAVGVILSDEYFLSVGYPWWGYWGGYYPGWPGWGYYPPVTTAYRYETGTVLIDMLDFTSTNTDTVNVVWQAGLNGLASSKSTVNSNRILSGINQAFDQSSYLKSAGPGGP